MTDRSWHIAPVDIGLVQELAAGLGVSLVTAEVLARRGYDSTAAAETFLRPDHKVHSPYLLANMGAAVERIEVALKRSESITVYGDYDADGITATFLLADVLRSLGGVVTWRLPNRFSDGYGLSPAVVDELAADGTRLLITVDSGIAAGSEVAQAQSLGLDVIITDHHEPQESLPDCIVINPKLGAYPCRDLAGVGVALKLAHALLQSRGEARIDLPLALRPYVDVVALGTIADVVPLHDENRTLVAMGLGRLRSSPRPGLAALMEAAGLASDDLTAGNIGFRLAPRLNAAGRLEDATVALNLLAAQSRHEALPLALHLNDLNRERREIEASMIAEALRLVPDPLPPALVLSSADWHEVVVGIVAQRLAERLYRPSIVLSESDEVAKGSGRSIPGFDLLAAVTACSSRLTRFGGHKAACGLSLPRSAISEFRQAFTAFAARHLDETSFTRRHTVDAIVCGDELTLALADELEQLAPHGLGNPKVTLLLHGAEVQSPRLTRTRDHLQCKVRADGVCASAIHFNFRGLDDLSDGRRYDIPLTLGKNAYNGSVSAQIEVQALLPVQQPAHDLCPTACAAVCERALRGDALVHQVEALAALLAADRQQPTATAPGKAISSSGRRTVDERGRPLVSTLNRLAATGGRLLLLVADVARRRPLLTRDLALEPLGAEGFYLHRACLAGRLAQALPVDAANLSPVSLAGQAKSERALPAGAAKLAKALPAGPATRAGEPRLVMADALTAAATPSLVASFDHIVFVDPPFDRVTLDAVAAAAGANALLHFAWGQGEVDFAARVMARVYDLDGTLRRLWRSLAAAGGSLPVAFDALQAAEPLLVEPLVLAASLLTLREAGLLASGEGKNLFRPQQGKVDLAKSETYRLWHQRFQTEKFLAHCLKGPI
jgi:single-stranded-DNA-specific exonuclease